MEKTKQVKKTNKAKSATVKVKQTSSHIRRPKDQRQTLIGLGLGRIGNVSQLEDTASIRGMINKVSHLVVVLED